MGLRENKIYFSEVFQVSEETLDSYGAFNISVVKDLPLFIDPFLLFNSEDPKYEEQHEQIIKYLKFLKKKSLETNDMSKGNLDSWYIFPEVKQNWLGYSEKGNAGRGLRTDFARSLNSNLHRIFTNFSEETITKGSHLEKLCLINEGVGKDNISDFVTNLIKDYLLSYTELFSIANISLSLRKKVAVNKVIFNYETESWQSKIYDLPYFNNDFIILTPKNLLTKGNLWINREEMINHFEDIPFSIGNQALRAQVNNYFNQLLSKNPKKAERREAAQKTILQFPEIIDYYIRSKEDNGESAVEISNENVEASENYYIKNIQALILKLKENTSFYTLEDSDSYKEAIKRANYLKQVVEKNDGYKMFYSKDMNPIEREIDLQVVYRLVWYGTKYDVNMQPNNGRGPADFTASMGAANKTVIEMKLAKNTHLKSNLKKQVEIYAEANNTKKMVKIIIYFTKEELQSVNKILAEVGLHGKENIILIDARKDNKQSASKV